MFFDSVPWLSFTLFGNAGVSYMEALALFFGVLLAAWLFVRYGLWVLRRVAERTSMRYDDVIVSGIGGIAWPFYVIVAVFVAAHTLVLHPWVDRGLTVLLTAGLLYYAVKVLGGVIDAVAERMAAKREEEGTSAIFVIAKIAKALSWLMAFLLLLANLGIEITPLIAGLGVGGIAVAFALQNILEDLFSSFSIYFDKPFKKGDFIIVGADMGVVKYVGMKTTRLQTLQGQELIISNKELTNTRVNNYGRMDRRRVVFGFGLEYGTPVAKLERANGIVRSVVDAVENADLDRTHFKEFGDSALVFEVVYYVTTPDYNTYMDIQQDINLRIKEAFEAEKISMAFPTRTLHVHQH